MNHLLRTLTESQVKPATDLRLLLTTVKEGRKQLPEAKLTDPFYDALEGLLLDLKTVTVDNRDAEAFLKPVSKAEVPDYYDFISNPMDFQTMLKKVKQKSYRSKREFQDDLDLIWSNCYTYNASENHPLRRCVDRLKAKAERLLKYITDRRDRYDPSIPFDLPAPSGVRPRINGFNGHINGRSSHTRSPSIISPTHISKGNFKPRRNVAFPDSLAIMRTPEGMAMFRDLNNDVGSSQPKNTLAHTLREMIPLVEYQSDNEDNTAMAVDEPGPSTGKKRKSNGNTDNRPSKRTRFSTQYPTPLLEEKDDLSQLWWGAVQSDELLANGLPGIPFGPSSSISHRKKLKRKRPKGPSPSVSSLQNPSSLLAMMNSNIKTMRRLRHTHAKFVALNTLTAAQEEDETTEGLYAGLPSSTLGNRASGTTVFPGTVTGYGAGDDDVVDEKIDERPWILRGRKGKLKPSGIEIGVENGTDCLHWATEKILEHIGFQGTSKVARDVLSTLTAEYFSNVGRTIRYLVDKFGKTMTHEEIILHTLFESGTSKVQELERYISDDVERYGNRLVDLEKKLESAYRETTAVEAVEDEGLFEEESDGETGALAIGEFADILGEDYLGLRALGIADEFGLSALSIPKKLLRGKKGQNKPAAAKPTEPPPPFPPPPPFVHFTVSMADDQVGLLKPYYQHRFAMLATAQGGSPLASHPLPGPPPASFPPTPLPGLLPVTHGLSGPSSAIPTVRPDLVLPDDIPNPAQLKISPIGQIIKTGASAAKKKASSKTVSTEGGLVGTPGSGVPSGLDGAATKKKKGNTGVGSGNGRKKKPEGSAPPPVFGNQGNPMLPAVVIASA